MERDINVVVRIKEDGTMSFVSGDGLPLNMGGQKLYRHLITMHDDEEHGNNFYCRFEYISTSAKPIEYLNELPLGEYPARGYYDDTDGGKYFPASIYMIDIANVEEDGEYYFCIGMDGSDTESWKDMARPGEDGAGVAGYITYFKDTVTEIK